MPEMEYENIMVGIRKIIRSINLESKRVQKEFGLSLPQFLCLSFIHQRENGKTQTKDIKQYLNLNASTVTGIISRLERNGYVRRVPHDVDKRGFYIVLSAKGEQMMQNAPNSIQERLAARLAQLPASQLVQISSAIQLLVSTMDSENLDAGAVLSTDEQIG